MHKLLLSSFKGYKYKHVKRDFIAALVVTAIAIPESLGFAAIVGLPLQAGLYSALFAPIIFALFASTKRLVVGADSATAALVASGAALVAVAGSDNYPVAIAVLGLLTAFCLIGMAVLKMGFLADLISRPVLVGFLGGVGIQLIIHKFPEMLGVEAATTLWQGVLSLPNNLSQINGMTLTISILVVGVIVMTRKTRIPGELVALVLATLFAFMFNVANYDVKLVGELPAGIPFPVHPELTIGMIVALFPAALAIALVILAQSSAVITSLAGQHDENPRINQDLLALGFANATSAFTHGFAVNGSPPRSLAADMAGAKSQMVNVFMGLFIALVLLFGTGLFVYMPSAALAAIVFMIGIHLIRVRELRYIWHAHRTEFFVAMIALVGVALFGVRQGLLIAVIVALMERLRRQYRPHDQILLRDGELSEWARERIDGHHRHSSRPPGLLVYSFDGSLFFENIAYFTHRLKRAINDAKDPVHYVVVDAGAIDSIDYTAVETMKQLYRQLSADNIKIGFAHVSPNLRDQFNAFGMTDLIGAENIFSTLNSAIKSHPGNKRSAVDMVKYIGLERGSYVVIGGAVLEVLNLRSTNDIDLVVSDEVYRYFRDEEHWKEYVQDNGKKILTRHGYNLMHMWMGRDLKKLLRDAFEINGVTFMNIDQLIAAKTHLARKKDLDDVLLLQDYKKHIER